MWDIVTDIVLLEIFDRLPKPLRIGCATVLGLFVVAILIAVVAAR